MIPGRGAVAIGSAPSMTTYWPDGRRTRGDLVVRFLLSRINGPEPHPAPAEKAAAAA